jgi:hypothetical protein
MVVDPEGRIFFFYQLDQSYWDYRVFFIVSDNGKPFQGPFILPTPYNFNDYLYVAHVTLTTYAEIFIAYDIKYEHHLIHGNSKNGFVMDTILPDEDVNGYNKWYYVPRIILPDENDPDRIMLVGTGPDHTDGSEDENNAAPWPDIYVSFSYDGGLTFSKWRPVTSADDRNRYDLTYCFVRTAHFLPNGGFEILGYYDLWWGHGDPKHKNVGIIVTSPDDGTTCSTASFTDPDFSGSLENIDHAAFFSDHILVDKWNKHYILETERY